jgi:hypothetical protein
LVDGAVKVSGLMEHMRNFSFTKVVTYDIMFNANRKGVFMFNKGLLLGMTGLEPLSVSRAERSPFTLRRSRWGELVGSL